MRLLASAVLSTLLLFGVAFSAHADLLDDATAGGATGVAPMSASELDSVVGEGTLDKFVEIPNLARSFEHHIVAGTNMIDIVAVAGSGISISVSGPSIPQHP